MRPLARRSSSPRRAHVGELPGGVLAGGAQQDVVGLVLAQRVVDQVGAEGDLAARFLLAGKRRSIRPGDHRDIAERAAQHGAIRSIHASRSSPSMSSSNSWSTLRLVGGRRPQMPST